MMDFITVPLTTGIVFLAFYKVIELFVCRKERMAIIEKIGDKLSTSSLTNELELFNYGGLHISFSALKTGCLLIGIGLGMLIGLLIHIYVASMNDLGTSIGIRNMIEVAYGAPVLLFGGLGLIVAFIVEMRVKKSE
jgi:hypothetical protein